MVFQKWHFKNLFLCLSGLSLVQQSFLFLPSSFLKLCLAVSSSPVPACTVLFWTMPSGSLCLTSIWTCIITGINGVPTLSNMNLVPGRFFSIGLCPTDGMFWDSWSMGCYSTVWISYLVLIILFHSKINCGLCKMCSNKQGCGVMHHIESTYPVNKFLKIWMQIRK